MGAILIGLAVCVLVVDQHFEPWFPFLFLLLMLLAGIACFELLRLLPESRRPRPWLCFAATGGVLLVNWIVHGRLLPAEWSRDPWYWISVALAAATLAAFLVEMAKFREPGEAVPRIALTIWIVAYLGLLPSFLAELRWLPADRGALCVALAIFVPKSCDIGAYFTGRFLGKHPMAPVLSPKKTWEGAAGGLALAVLVTIGLDRLGPEVPGGFMGEIGFGLTVGGAGMLGDLAESLIKRDCGHKDASQVVPGFGGVLDVVDAIIFAAPVSYCWLV
jgi:phosphatidate cytidylyltransferase